MLWKEMHNIVLINVYQPIPWIKKGARICSVYQFLWCKYSHHGSYQHKVTEYTVQNTCAESALFMLPLQLSSLLEHINHPAVPLRGEYGIKWGSYHL